MKKRKTYEVSVINKTYSKTYSDETKFYTSDTALELNFQLKEVEYDFDSAEIILLNIDDRSLVTRPVSKSAIGFTYELEDDITSRFGEWKGQLKFNEGGEIYVSSPVSFRIENDLNNDRPPQLTDIRDWETLRQNARDLIAEMGDIVANESARIEAEKQRVEGYQEVRNIIDTFEIGENSVGTENIKDSAVTIKKANFILASKNLLIIEETSTGKMWGGNASNDVVLTDNINITASEPISLKSGATHIYKNKVGGAIFADGNNKLVQFNGMSTPVGSLEIPSGAKKVMLNIYNADVNTYQLEYGLNGTDYVRGSYGLDDTIKLNGENIENIKGSAIETGSVPLNKLELERSLNLFDRTNLQSGYIDRWSGGVTSDDVNKTSDYIPLSDNNIIFNKITNNLNIAYYNSNGVFMLGEQVIGPKTNAIVTPTLKDGYFRFSVNANDVRDLIVQYGDSITATRDYYVYPKGLALPAASSESNDFNQLNIKSTANSMGIYKKGTKKESNKWLRMGFDYFKDLPTNADGWGITTVDAVSMDGLGNFSTIFPVTIGGEWEMAIMIDAAPDFIGLRQHGSEIMTSIKFYRDGISFIPKSEDFNCDELKVIEKTKMFDPTDETSHVANHIKEYIWTTENLTINHKIEWLSSHNIGNSYLTMMPVTRGNDTVTSVQVTDTYYDNETYDEWDVSNSGFETYPNLREVKGSKIYLYGKDSGVSVSAESVRNKPNGRSFVQNTPNGYNKIYFFMTETSVSAGDVTTGTSVYEFNINT